MTDEEAEGTIRGCWKCAFDECCKEHQTWCREAGCENCAALSVSDDNDDWGA